eukprot:gb/GECH01003335.1/.p1 GENE.gb/GECH01003335.1/~~gb/GECH01003335.1/.p1  ORF type:complete len:471 (+),score=101.80 gb/GECH01003335.1/:1-1413(+)
MSLAEDLKHAYNNKEWSDVQLCVNNNQEGETRTYYGHSVILGNRSCVLQKELREKKKKRSNRCDETTTGIKPHKTREVQQGNPNSDLGRYIYIFINNVPFNIWETFMKYLYTNEANIDMSNVFELLQISVHYQVNTLIQLCCSQLESNISPNNALILYSQAVEQNQDEIINVAESYICENASEIMNLTEKLSPSEMEKVFRFVSIDAIKQMLQLPDFVVPEKDIWRFVKSWAHMKCKRDNEKGQLPSPEDLRSVMENVLPLIRFPTMTANEFSEHVVPTKILTERETIDVFIYLSTESDTSTPFEKTPRKASPFPIQFEPISTTRSFPLLYEVSKGGTEAKKTKKNNIITILRSQNVLSRGEVAWQFRIDAKPEGDVHVGLIPTNFSFAQFWLEEAQICIKEHQFTTGDKIGFIVDMDNGEVAVFRNNHLIQTYRRLSSEMYAAIAARPVGTKISILKWKPKHLRRVLKD